MSHRGPARWPHQRDGWDHGSTMTSPTTAPPRQRAPVRGRLLVIAIFLVALNLRAALASLPPLMHTIEHDLGLSGAVARVALLVGLLLRLGGGALPLLMVSTLLAGAGIALCGTVLPGIVKEFFAHRPGVVTGVYLLAMMVGATAAAAGSVPLADLLGSWQASLAVWAVPAVVGLIAWLPVVRAVNDHEEPEDSDGRAPVGPLPWRSVTAWLLASYLALQSWGFYSQLAWVAPSYEARGWSARDAGLLMAV